MPVRMPSLENLFYHYTVQTVMGQPLRNQIRIDAGNFWQYNEFGKDKAHLFVQLLCVRTICQKSVPISLIIAQTDSILQIPQMFVQRGDGYALTCKYYTHIGILHHLEFSLGIITGYFISVRLHHFSSLLFVCAKKPEVASSEFSRQMAI